jgi:hypothetical protein
VREINAFKESRLDRPCGTELGIHSRYPTAHFLALLVVAMTQAIQFISEIGFDGLSSCLTIVGFRF